MILNLAINRIPRLKTAEKLELADGLADASEFSRLTAAGLRQWLKRSYPTEQWRPSLWLDKAEKEITALEANRIEVDFHWSKNFPPQLREIHDPPFLLYRRGSCADYYRRFASLVGTRQPSGLGIKAAFSLAYGLAGAKVYVVSGLALGIDAQAHQGALAAGGQTIAVMACGLDRVYPRRHQALAYRILEQGGAWLSEYSCGEPPARYRFVARNRLISGLSRAVVVIEAPKRSGALLTADFGLQQGREVWIYGPAKSGPAGAGLLKLDEAGAQNLAEPEQLLNAWGEKNINLKIQTEDYIDRPAELVGLEMAGQVINFQGQYYRRPDL